MVFFLNPSIIKSGNKIKLLVLVRQLKHILFILVYFIFCRFLLTFKYCFFYLIKNLTVIYSSSDTAKLGRPFITFKKKGIFPSGGLFIVRRIRETTIQLRAMA